MNQPCWESPRKERGHIRAAWLILDYGNQTAFFTLLVRTFDMLFRVETSLSLKNQALVHDTILSTLRHLWNIMLCDFLSKLYTNYIFLYFICNVE